MHRGPKYDFIDAITVAAAEANQLLHGQYNPDVLIWETLEVNRIKDAGGYIAAIINELGKERYMKIRQEVALADKKRAA